MQEPVLMWNTFSLGWNIPIWGISENGLEIISWFLLAGIIWLFIPSFVEGGLFWVIT